MKCGLERLAKIESQSRNELRKATLRKRATFHAKINEMKTRGAVGGNFVTGWHGHVSFYGTEPRNNVIFTLRCITCESSWLKLHEPERQNVEISPNLRLCERANLRSPIPGRRNRAHSDDLPRWCERVRWKAEHRTQVTTGERRSKTHGNRV